MLIALLAHRGGHRRLPDEPDRWTSSEIAEHDIPMTTAVTQITIHQLEQAIALKRAVRFGEEMRTDLNAGKSFEVAGTENTETLNLQPGVDSP